MSAQAAAAAGSRASGKATRRPRLPARRLGRFISQPAHLPCCWWPACRRLWISSPGDPSVMRDTGDMGAAGNGSGPAAAGVAALGIAAAAGTTDQRGPPDEGCIRDELFAAIQSAPFSNKPEALPDGRAVRPQKEAGRGRGQGWQGGWEQAFPSIHVHDLHGCPGTQRGMKSHTGPSCCIP